MGRLRAAAISSWRMRPVALHIARRALVVVVEADLAAGDDFRLGQQRVEFGERGIVGFGGVVRIDAGACVEPRKIRPGR